MNESKTFSEEVHHRVVRKFPRRRVEVYRVDEIWALDLASMETVSKYNEGYKYILCIIDVFSKYAWCVPLKNKTGPSILEAIKLVVDESDRSPEKIWVDQGGEFYNKGFQDWANKNGITIYSTYGDSKSAVVERFIRTLREMIMREFTATNSRNWVDILSSILDEYNNRKHKTIKMTPMEASEPENATKVYNNLYEGIDKPKKKEKFKVGDKVRISKIKGKFEKGSSPNFTHEVFTIKDVLDTNPVTYKIIDYNGDIIDGSYYEQELLKTKVPDHYEVEQILKTRKVDGKKEHFVHFFGWPKKFDAWIPEENISDI